MGNKKKGHKIPKPPTQPKDTMPTEADTETSKVMPMVEKTKEEILAEREAKKAEKAARKAKNKDNDKESNNPPLQNDKVKPTEGEKSQTQKSKAELKAERRAKQEAQRAAKGVVTKDKPSANEEKVNLHRVSNAPSSAPTTSSKTQKGHRVPDDIQADRASIEKKLQKKLASAHITPRTKVQRKVMLFSHLHQYEREFSIGRNIPIVGSTIPTSVIQLGMKYAEGSISGSNSRCVAFLNVMKKVIDDYTTPVNKELSRDLDSKIKPYITFLKQCKALSVSMGNAIRFLKGRINSLRNDITDEEAKIKLTEAIDNFVHENITLAAKQISITANKKIRDGDVILTYGYSSLMKSVLLEAVRRGKNIKVIVADGRIRYEGQKMVLHLLNANIDCTYISVSSVPHFMSEVTKVFLGAHAVLANGSVMARVGTSQVALIAKASDVPVLVCCETYKFSERVQTDSFVFNELGDPDDLVPIGCPKYAPLNDWRDLNALCLLNLSYDVTPPTVVDGIISEISVIPTTSVPVVLRFKNMDQ